MLVTCLSDRFVLQLEQCCFFESFAIAENIGKTGSVASRVLEVRLRRSERLGKRNGWKD